MEFKKYQHIERFGTDEVEGIEFGKCYVFYKIDGTNSSVWLNKEGIVKAGSRNRELTLDNDNASFYKNILENVNVKNYLDKHPDHRLYGEWLVPHSLKTYRDDAWRKFYVFDVCIGDYEVAKYLEYDEYKSLLDEFDIDYIPAICSVENPNSDFFLKQLNNTGEFLIEDGKGFGEGVVIKNYSFINKYGRQVWAKIVRNDFKEKHVKSMGTPDKKVKKEIEQAIVDVFCTNHFVEKEYQKIVTIKDGWNSKYIPELINRCFYEFVNENAWEIIKKFKSPTIDYRRLNGLLTQKIKEIKSELF